MIVEVQDQEGMPLAQANSGNFVKVFYNRDVAANWEVLGLLRKNVLPV